MMVLPLLLTSLLSLMPLQQPAGNLAIEGQVVRSNTDPSAPIAQARVVLARTQVTQTPAGPRYNEVATTRSDSSGRFRLEGIPAGSYLLLATAEGFVTGQFGQRALNRPGSPLTVSEAGVSSPVVLRLTPTSTITGFVRDFDNEPMPGVNVQVSKVSYGPDGRRGLTLANSTTTDDRGAFRLYWVTPDEYVVSASMPVVLTGGRLQPRNPSQPPPRVGYAATYFPGVTDMARAQLVKVNPGETRDGVVFQLRPAASRNISGTVTDAATGRPARTILQLMSNVAGAGFTARQGQSNETGKYEFKAVPEGSYTIIAFALPDESRNAVGILSLQDKDVSDFNLTLKDGDSVRGKVTVEGATPQLNRLNIGLNPVSGLGALGNNSGPLAADGSFEIRGLQSGEFELFVSGVPADYFVKSARLGNADAWTSPISISNRTSETLEIILSSGAGSIRGTVVDQKGAPFASGSVVLIPESRLRGKSSYYKTGTTDQNGNVTLRGIPPGQYTLFAWDYVEGYAFFNPEFLRQYEAKGTPVTLEENKQLDLRIQVIEQN